MSEPYLGEIRLFAGNFAPRTNALCNGQTMSIAQNTALFSLLGTYYGGNGTTTFNLPDLQGRLPVGQGQGPSLSNYTIGETIGTESVTLATGQMPMHTHLLLPMAGNATQNLPGGQFPSALQTPFKGFYVKDANKTGNPVAMYAGALQNTGGNQPHENRMPAMAISIIIALQGVFPSRN
jgi:microcystin-dependent protein